MWLESASIVSQFCRSSFRGALNGANDRQVNEVMAARDRELVELYSYPAHGHSSGVSTGSQNAVGGNRLYGETTYRTVSQKA